MSRNIKWVHAPSHEAASHWLPAGYSLPTRPAASRAFFALGESLTLYEAARIISGRHPYPVSPDGVTTLGPRWEFIAAGSTGATRRRHRPARAKEAFEALQQKVMIGAILDEMPRLSHPGTISDGGIDWLNVRIKTADVIDLCNERGWRPRFLRDLDDAGGPSPQPPNETECRAWLAALPEAPRLKRKDAFERFNRLRREAKREIIGERAFLRAWKKSAPVSWHAPGRLPGT
jgi:hypothetical protein